jgi:hypothetical protein
MNANIKSDDGVSVAFNQEKKQVEVSYAGKVFILAHENGQSVVKDAEGNILAIAQKGEDGSMTMVDTNGKVLSSYSADEVSAMLASK